jgi:hypothetical protein
MSTHAGLVMWRELQKEELASGLVLYQQWVQEFRAHGPEHHNFTPKTTHFVKLSKSSQ